MKTKNKIVPVPTRVRFPVDFESVVSRKTHDALIGPGSCENVLVLRKSEQLADNARGELLSLVRFGYHNPTQFYRVSLGWLGCSRSREYPVTVRRAGMF